MFNNIKNFEFKEKYSKELASFGISRKELNEFIPLFKDMVQVKYFSLKKCKDISQLEKN